MRALDGVDLHVAAGEFVVVLGPSGCGKTTLLNLIGALDTATEGSLRVGGVDISRAGRRELFEFRRHDGVVRVPELQHLPRADGARRTCSSASSRRPGAPAPTPRRSWRAWAWPGRGDSFPHQLSGGEQQRVAIARALATGNPVLLADEPTGELDFRTGVQILGLLEGRAAEGRAVLVVTHNREISRAADRVVELSSGRIVSDGPPAGGRARTAELHW